MRLPSWLRTKRQERVGNTLEVKLDVDTRALEAAIRRLGVAMQGAGVTAFPAFSSAVRAAAEAERKMAAFHAEVGDETVESFRRMVRRELNRAEVRQAGLEARYYVRGGMDPRFNTPEARDAYAQDLLASYDPRLAVAFLRGWTEHHPEPVCECWPTPESMHYVYHGVTEPGSAWEWNPDCPVHRGAHVDPNATAWPAPEVICDGRCVEGWEVLEGAPGGSMYAVDPFCSLHGDGPPELEDCHADGQGPCVAVCCPIRGMGLCLPCPPTHPVSSGVR